MLGDIDVTKKILKPRLSLCKPNEQTIANLVHVMKPTLDLKLGSIYELNFELPYNIDSHHTLIRYAPIDQIRNMYLIKFEYANLVEYFTVDKLTDNMDTSGNRTKQVHAYSRAYELKNKLIGVYQEDSQTIDQVTSYMLQYTNWSLGHVDDKFVGLYRMFDITNQTVLDIMSTICEAFGCFVIYDSVNRTVNFYDEDTYGNYYGLNYNYGKYLQSIGNLLDSTNFYTRMYPYGNNGLTINAVNPTGQEFFDDYSFFLNPFLRDSNKNVISHSDYMSDALCNALLDYQDLVNSVGDEFKFYLNELIPLQTQMTTLDNDMSDLQTQLAIAQDNLDTQKSTETSTIFNFTYSGASTTKTATINSMSQYAVMIMSTYTSNLTVKVDGTTKTLTSNKWSITKVQNATSTSIALSGNNNSGIKIYVVQISSDEFTKSGNDTDLLTKYNDVYEQSLIDAKQSEIDSLQSQIDQVNTLISNLQTQISAENNFTADELIELNNYIIEYSWTNDSYIDAQDLLDAAKKEFASMNTIPAVLTIDSVNFMESVESQRDWYKLNLGDYVMVKFDEFGLKDKAQITELNFDFDSKTVQMTVANVKDISDKDKILKQLQQASQTSQAFGVAKYKIDQIDPISNDVDNILNDTWNAIRQEIVAGVNETVTINRRGITITDNTNPDRIIVLTNGVIGISDDGGLNWKTALTPDGIIAERLLGQIIIGEQLQMQNTSGKMSFDDNGLTLTTTDNTKRILMTETDGIKVQISTDNGTTWKDEFYVNSNGQLIANGLGMYTSDGSTMLIDGTSKTIDFSKFNVIAGQLSAENIDVASATNLNTNSKTDPTVGGYSGGSFVTDNSSPSGNSSAYNQTGRDVHYGSSFDVSPGELFYVGGWAKLVSGTNDFNFGVDFLDSDGSTHHWNVAATASHSISGWQYVEGTVTAPDTATTATVWYQIPVTSNFGSWYFTKSFVRRQGMITFDKAKGGTLTLGGNGNGNGELLVLDENGETIADLEATSGGFDKLSIGTIMSPSIYNASNVDQIINVSSNISSALHSIPPLNNGNCTLVFQNDISENIDISNYLGDGTIEINLNGHKLNGNVYVHGCSPQFIHIHDGTINGTGAGLTLSDAVVEVDRCTYVRFDNVKVYGSGNPTYGFYCHAGSGAYLANCEIHNVQEAISSATSARVTVDNCLGSGTTNGLHSFYGGYICVFGSQPTGGTANTVATSGEVYPTGGVATSGGTSTPPPAPAQTSSWKATSSGNWSSSGYWDSSPKQGNWGYGQRSGYWFFGLSPSTAVSGKTIQSMRIKVTRSSSGGYSSDVGIVFRSHNYISQPSGTPSPLSESSYSTTVNLAWGESQWISLPSSFYADFQSGTAKGIGIYTSSTSKSDYAIMSGSSTLEITYS